MDQHWKRKIGGILTCPLLIVRTVSLRTCVHKEKIPLPVNTAILSLRVGPAETLCKPEHRGIHAHSALSLLTAPSFGLILVRIPTPTVPQGVAMGDIIFLQEIGARITYPPDYRSKPAVVDVIEAARDGSIGNQQGGAFGPVHAEKADVGAVAESLARQIYAPYIRVVNVTEQHEMILVRQVKNHLTIGQTL